LTRATDRRALTCTAVLLSAAMSHVAWAQSAAPTTRAESLFAQGKQALESNDFAHACPLLQESYGIDPALGTLLALAVCHEGVGRTATAWHEFRTAADGAAREGRADRERFAQAHISKLEGHLSKLTVAVSSDSPPGLVVEVDGTALPVDQWGTEQVIDPGHHVVAAHAPKRQPWSGGVDIGPEHDVQTVTVGALAPEASDAAASPPPATDVTQAPAPDTSTPGTWKRPAGWITGGVGLAAVGVGAVFGVVAITKSSDAKSKCSQSSCTDPAAVSENQDAKTAATISDVAIGAGLVAVAVGAWFLFTAPSAPSASSALPIMPFVGHEQAGIALIRTW
jgi:hypothetical protein